MTKSKKGSSIKEESLDTDREHWEVYQITKIIRAPSLKKAVESEHLAKVVEIILMRNQPALEKMPDIFGEKVGTEAKLQIGFNCYEE